MADHHRYVIHENIERFETLLQSGELDRRQTGVVCTLLAQARADLARLDGPGCMIGAPVRNGMATRAAGTRADGTRADGTSQPVRLCAGSPEPAFLDRVHC